MQDLETLAKQVAAQAYCRYSRFRVGAALKTKSKSQYIGCNVENVSFGLTICAERNAIAAMVAAGETQPESIVVYTPTDRPTLPCGACRQVLLEFNAEIKIKCVCDSEETFEGSLSDLLPHAFPVDSLEENT